MDIKSFYPSLDPIKAVNVARIMWDRSPLIIQNVDYDRLLKYLSKKLTNDEIENEKISELLYKKKPKRKMKHTNVKKRIKMKKIPKNIKKKNIKKKKLTFDDKWDRPKNKPNPMEKRKLMGIAIEKLILTSMKNHIYSYNGVKRIQCKGAATGLDETGDLADLFMLWWDSMFLKLVEKCKLNLDIYTRFKDDTGILMDRITDYNIELEKILENDYVRFSDFPGNSEEYTARMMSNLANSVCKMINFTVDTPSMNEDGMMPILDVKVKIGPNNEVVHDFYEKPTKNQCVVLASSALSWTQKRSIHTQEMLRRLKNTSTILGPEIQNDHISKYLLKMKICGYKQKFRSEVLKSAKSAYNKILEKHRIEETPFYKNRKELDQIKSKKIQTPQNWWQKTAKNTKP